VSGCALASAYLGGGGGAGRGDRDDDAEGVRRGPVRLRGRVGRRVDVHVLHVLALPPALGCLPRLQPTHAHARTRRRRNAFRRCRGPDALLGSRRRCLAAEQGPRAARCRRLPPRPSISRPTALLRISSTLAYTRWIAPLLSTHSLRGLSLASASSSRGSAAGWVLCGPGCAPP
jgi:hypothetical protein